MSNVFYPDYEYEQESVEPDEDYGDYYEDYVSSVIVICLKKCFTDFNIYTLIYVLVTKY